MKKEFKKLYNIGHITIAYAVMQIFCGGQIFAVFNDNRLYCGTFYENVRTAFDFKIKNAIKDRI